MNLNDVIPTEAQRSGELALSEVEWESAVCLGLALMLDIAITSPI